MMGEGVYKVARSLAAQIILTCKNKTLTRSLLHLGDERGDAGTFLVLLLHYTRRSSLCLYRFVYYT